MKTRPKIGDEKGLRDTSNRVAEFNQMPSRRLHEKSNSYGFNFSLSTMTGPSIYTKEFFFLKT